MKKKNLELADIDRAFDVALAELEAKVTRYTDDRTEFLAKLNAEIADKFTQRMAEHEHKIKTDIATASRRKIGGE